MQINPESDNRHQPRQKPSALETKEILKHLTIEYYKNKNNGIERHSEDLLTTVLVFLAKEDVKDYQQCLNALKMGSQDALGIKSLLQASNLPKISDFSYDEYVRFISSGEYSRSGYKDFINRLTQEEKSQYLEEQKRIRMDAREYKDRIARGEIDGLQIRDAGGIEALFSKTYIAGEPKGYRINIHVPISETVQGIIADLTKKITQEKDAMQSGFGIKHGTGDRDGVILYVKEGAFSSVAKVVIEHFEGDFHYHGRDANPGIMFGVPLESQNQHKFPSIRVTSDPSEPYSTFNEMQADIVSKAAVDYIGTYYQGEHKKMLEHFRDDYYEAFLQWEKSFPNHYKKTVTSIFGEEQPISNVAFLGS